MANLLMGRNFVSGICKLKPKNLFFKSRLFTSPVRICSAVSGHLHGHSLEVILVRKNPTSDTEL